VGSRDLPEAAGEPGERVDKLHMGILIDSIRKAKSVSQTVPDNKGLPHI